MDSSAMHRAEEARFLANMRHALGPMAMSALATIRQTLRLDYAGVDFAIAPDGRLILFEANATMTLVAPPAGPVWDYRREAYDSALAAAQTLIRISASGLRENFLDNAVALPPSCTNRLGE